MKIIISTRKIGGGGQYSTKANCLKTFLTVAAVIVASLLITACPPPDDAVGGGDQPKPPNTDPETQLKSLSVVYTGKNVNLITFDGSKEDQEQTYAVVDTLATEVSVKVEAEAKSSNAKVRIWWVNASKGGGMEEGTKNLDSLDNIPLPQTQDDTIIFVAVSNPYALNDEGEPKYFEYEIRIPPADIDTTLKSLKVLIGGNHVDIAFNAKTTQYYIQATENQVSNDAKVTIEAEATANSPPPGEEAGFVPPSTVIISPEVADALSGGIGVVVPSASDATPKTFTITVTNGITDERPDGLSSVYTVIVVPPQNDETTDARLMVLQFEYDNGSNPVMDFSPDKTDYSLKVPEGVNKVKISQAIAHSSKSSITVTKGGAAYTKAGNPLSYPLVDLPSNQDAPSLVFTVTVEAGNRVTRPYTVTFTNPKQTVAWSGTADFIGGTSGGRTILHVEAQTLDGPFASDPIKTDNAWSMTIDKRYRPSAFVVVMQKIESGKTVQYRQSFPVVEATAVKGNNLLVDGDKAPRVIYSANDLALLGETQNNNQNWIVSNDIDLDEYVDINNNRIAWNGPDTYYGTFDGNGKTIKNFKITQTAGATGLFDAINPGATLKNFTLNVVSSGAITMTDSSWFGGVVGYITARSKTGKDFTISGVTVNGRLEYGAPNTPSGKGFLMVGGLIGEVNGDGGTEKVFIDSCVSNIEIIANFAETSLYNSGSAFHASPGGLIGKTYHAKMTLSNSYSTGNITITGGNTSGERNFSAGGLISFVGDGVHGADNVTIRNCYSTGTIAVHKTTGTTMWAEAGGLVGGVGQSANITITNSAALNPLVTAKNDFATDKCEKNRIIGGGAGTRTLTNNFALDTAKVGTTASDAVTVTGGSAGNSSGLDKNLAAFKTKATWTAAAPSGLGFSETVWDFSTITTTGRPTLK